MTDIYETFEYPHIMKWEKAIWWGAELHNVFRPLPKAGHLEAVELRAESLKIFVTKTLSRLSPLHRYSLLRIVSNIVEQEAKSET